MLSDVATGSPVPTDVSAATTLADTPASAASPFAALLEAFDEMDRRGSGDARVVPRVHKRWQAKGCEVCIACGTVRTAEGTVGIHVQCLPGVLLQRPVSEQRVRRTRLRGRSGVHC